MDIKSHSELATIFDLESRSEYFVYSPRVGPVLRSILGNFKTNDSLVFYVGGIPFRRVEVLLGGVSEKEGNDAGNGKREGVDQKAP